MYTIDTHVVRALTIAGSDSGGGAGIQADLKTMQQFGVYGMSVITAVTAQNTLGVQGIAELEPFFIRQQLHSVLQDLGADTVKTGMLSSSAIIREVANFLSEHRPPYLVVDPVMIAKGGATLLKEDAMTVLVSDLLPLADIVTPNIPEAEALCGFSLDTLAARQRAAEFIAAWGPGIVVIKGGHLLQEMKEWAVDLVFVRDSGYTYLAAPRVNTKKSHGTGCTFSAAITAMLARGASPLQAIATAKAFISDALQNAAHWDIGAGHGPTDHSTKISVAPKSMSQRSYAFINHEWIEWEA